MIILKSKEDYSRIPSKKISEINSYIGGVVANTKFYSEKLKNWHPNISKLYDAPITYDYELEAHPYSFIRRKENALQMSLSGGTTGKGKLIFRTANDLRKSIKTTIRIFKCCGITKLDNVIISQPFDLWDIGHLALKSLQEIGCLTCPGGLSMSKELVSRILPDSEFNVIYSTPSKVLLQGEYLKEKNLLKKVSLDKILCAGEPLTSVYRKKIYSFFKAEPIGIYGSEETDGIGAECNEREGYHLLNENVIFEILDPETLKPAEKNEGVLVPVNIKEENTGINLLKGVSIYGEFR